MKCPSQVSPKIRTSSFKKCIHFELKSLHCTIFQMILYLYLFQPLCYFFVGDLWEEIIPKSFKKINKMSLSWQRGRGRVIDYFSLVVTHAFLLFLG